MAELRLDLHAEFICELSVAASKELAIEEAIAKIAEVWMTFELDMVEDKGVRPPTPFTTSGVPNHVCSFTAFQSPKCTRKNGKNIF